jgi:23S rRNA pseudouridine1911/1915/1917 synthase
MSNIISKSFTVTDKEFLKVDHIVMSLCNLPRSQIRALFDNECVFVNGQKCTNPARKLNLKDQLTLTYDSLRKYKEKKKGLLNSAFKVIYEDGHLMVVDKAAGVLTVPTTSGDGIGSSLLDHLNRYVPKSLNVEVVHRLDRDTSGLLVFAKSKGICHKLKDQFEKRKPQRVYFAFVRGHLSSKSGTFRSFLASDVDLNQRSVKDETKGKLAITHYVVEKELDDSTWVKVTLETGRRNQIRVHFSEANHPILGDQRYRRDLSQHPKWKDNYLALHATTLGFNHPISGKPLFFESQLPRRMREFLELE